MSERMKKYLEEAKVLIEGIKSFEIETIPWEKKQEVDDLNMHLGCHYGRRCAIWIQALL